MITLRFAQTWRTLESPRGLQRIWRRHVSSPEHITQLWFQWLFHTNYNGSEVFFLEVIKILPKSCIISAYMTEVMYIPYPHLFQYIYMRLYMYDWSIVWVFPTLQTGHIHVIEISAQVSLMNAMPYSMSGHPASEWSVEGPVFGVSFCLISFVA